MQNKIPFCQVEDVKYMMRRVLWNIIGIYGWKMRKLLILYRDVSNEMDLLLSNYPSDNCAESILTLRMEQKLQEQGASRVVSVIKLRNGAKSASIWNRCGCEDKVLTWLLISDSSWNEGLKPLIIQRATKNYSSLARVCVSDSDNSSATQLLS